MDNLKNGEDLQEHLQPLPTWKMSNNDISRSYVSFEPVIHNYEPLHTYKKSSYTHMRLGKNVYTFKLPPTHTFITLFLFFSFLFLFFVSFSVSSRVYNGKLLSVKEK